MPLSNQGSSKPPSSSSTGSSDLDPFYLERYVRPPTRSVPSRTDPTATSNDQLDHTPFSASDGFYPSAAGESEATEDVCKGREDQEYPANQGPSTDLDTNRLDNCLGQDDTLVIHGGEVLSSQEGWSSLSDDLSTCVTDSDQPGGYDLNSETTTLFDGLDWPLPDPFDYVSSSVYSDDETDDVGQTSPSSSPTLVPIPGFSPVTAADIADDLHPTRPITIPQPHSPDNARTLSSQELEFDENIGLKGPKEISYLEQYAIQEEKEAQERRQAAEKDEQREREAQPAPTATATFATFAQHQELARRVQEYAPSPNAKSLQWVAQVTKEMTGVATDAAGAPGDDSSTSSKSSSDFSSSSVNVPQFQEAARRDHSADHPHAHDEMAYEQSHAADMERRFQEGFQEGYKKGKKYGYDEACDDQRPILSTYEEYLVGQASEQSHQHGQPVENLSRDNGTAITKEELMHEIESMMYRLRIPYKGASYERSHDELRGFVNDVSLQLFADKDNKTPSPQENSFRQPTPASLSELGHARALSCLSSNSSPPNSTTEKLEDLDEFLNGTSDRWENQQQELREHECFARAHAHATSPRRQSGGSIPEDEEQADHATNQESPCAFKGGRCDEGEGKETRK